MFGWLSMRRGTAKRALVAGATLFALASTLALGACGRAALAQQGAGASSGTASVGGAPRGGMAVRPCPGQVGDASQVGAIALILTPNRTSGSLHIGELAQVRLPVAMHWTLNNQPSGLTGVGEAGGQDTTLNVCYWTFRAQSAGSATLNYSGTPPCDPSAGACSNVIVASRFTVTVSK